MKIKWKFSWTPTAISCQKLALLHISWEEDEGCLPLPQLHQSALHFFFHPQDKSFLNGNFETLCSPFCTCAATTGGTLILRNQSVDLPQFCNSPMKLKIICSLKSLIRNERVAEHCITVFWVQEQYNQPVDFIKMTSITVLRKCLLWRKEILYNLFCISIV